MRYLILTILTALATGCDKPPDQMLPPEPSTAGKIEGPAVRSLATAQLDEALKECMRYGKMDDPKVKYTPRYCSAVMSEHLQAGYTKTAPSKADPTITPMH